MPVKVVLGGQWGDEGKGKIVDTLCADVQIVARFQGGANAGHTIYRGDSKIVLHQLPSGILKEDALCLLGHGMVIDPVGLLAEISELAENGIQVKDRIRISPYATVITPWHRETDRLQEEMKSSGKKIGTTGKGIGPAYSDHVNRIALKAWQLKDPALLKSVLTAQAENCRAVYVLSEEDSLRIRNAEDLFLTAAAEIAVYVHDFTVDLHESLKRGENVLIEGAQGLLLDLHFGTYPYVTSSSTGTAGILAGLPLSFRDIDSVSGIFKAYTTRVGNGPFPTELSDSTGETLRKKGFEYGATTGRPRRCGWFDSVLARYSVRLNGLDSIIMTKIDVLNDFESVKAATAYELDGLQYDEVYGLMHRLADVKPVYETLPGWMTDLSGIRKYKDLPAETRRYIECLEDITGTRISMISTGMKRGDLVTR